MAVSNSENAVDVSGVQESHKISEVSGAPSVEKAQEEHRLSHRNRAIAIAVIFAIIGVSLIAAFIWPGWARHSADNGSHVATGTQAVVSVDPVVLPQDATDLEKILPDSVESYARGEVKSITAWESSEPTEEYQVVYTNGDHKADITVTFGQWTSADYANAQYTSLVSALKGDKKASGKVNVNGKETGAYELHTVEGNTEQSVVVWQNGTTVFHAQGPANAVNNFYAKFPY